VGFTPTGWQSEIWVLHAMYERADIPGGLSHDDVHRIELAARTTEPIVVNDVNLDEIGVLVGNVLGRSGHPGEGWARLRWTELARRLDTSIFANWHYPCVRSFSYRSWPANIQPPPEGSLDREQLQRLLGHLTTRSSAGDGQECFAYYPAWMTSFDGVDDVVLRLRLDEVLTLYEDAAVPGSPINLWPKDRSWFVWTDTDLWGTRVSGSHQLITDIQADDQIETTHAPEPPQGN
jgi:hypothetical protein